ncbi:30S ribosomal protein S8 [Candidatus Pacearchaeota archaeon]|nr:30S ribosomal protein S8 [Candidatus Pacearchaeota archaeon]
MSQDRISDILNEIMNAKRARKESIVITSPTQLLMKVFEIMKQYGYIEYETQEDKLKINIKQLNECKAIKPRYSVNKRNIEKYIRRFLPARNFGYVVISTSKGLMTHQEAQESKIGGSLIAYFY